ncbi:hypothetical protein [Streptomyces sp. C10-9-1]|uniref:hypothetical protein n=1 Tax=Streptomyces sp. C10-9-1 TaxID=1859285 RepID=UPI003F49EAFB
MPSIAQNASATPGVTAEQGARADIIELLTAIADALDTDTCNLVASAADVRATVLALAHGDLEQDIRWRTDYLRHRTGACPRPITESGGSALDELKTLLSLGGGTL